VCYHAQLYWLRWDFGNFLLRLALKYNLSRNFRGEPPHLDSFVEFFSSICATATLKI
jgi:hypothetical protein